MDIRSGGMDGRMEGMFSGNELRPAVRRTKSKSLFFCLPARQQGMKDEHDSS
jgi:hypothetical protein